MEGSAHGEATSLENWDGYASRGFNSSAFRQMKYTIGVFALCLALAGCGPWIGPVSCGPWIAQASPYFTGTGLCQLNGTTHFFIEPIPIDGFYTLEVWQLGAIPTVDEGGAKEVLRGDPPRLHFVAPILPARIVWKARGGDNWQPASRLVEDFPQGCHFV
jgi:hypothetical protein